MRRWRPALLRPAWRLSPVNCYCMMLFCTTCQVPAKTVDPVATDRSADFALPACDLAAATISIKAVARLCHSSKTVGSVGRVVESEARVDSEGGVPGVHFRPEGAQERQ